MSLILARIEWTSNNGQKIVFDDFESITVKRESESKPSSATITLKNYMDKMVTGFSYPLSKYVSTGNELLFNEGDTVRIYVAKTDTVRNIDTSDTSTDLLMTGELAEVQGKITDTGSKLTLKLVDKTWVILNKLLVFNYKTTLGWRTPQLVQDVVRQVTDCTSQALYSYDKGGNLKLKGTGNFTVDARLDTEPNSNGEFGYIETTRQDSTQFPVKGIGKVYKPAYEFVQDLSTIEYTNDFSTENEEDPPQDRTMLYYIDERNKFHWFYPSTTVGDGLSFIEGDTTTGNIIQSANLTYATFDITNLVFFNVGKDLYGNGISYYYYDKTTKSKDYKIVQKPYTEITKEMIEAEIKLGNLILDNAQTNFTYEGNFYKADAYGFTTSWNDDSTLFDDDAYNSSLREEAIIRGQAKASALVRRKGNPRWKGTIECVFKRYNVGDLISFTSTRLGINAKKLRIMGVIYTIKKDGGFTSLTVEEDEKRLGDT